MHRWRRISTPSSRCSYGDDVASISTQLMMTAMFRLKLTMKSTPKAECTKILKSQFYQRVRSSAEPTFAVDAALDGGARSLIDLCTGLVGAVK